MFISKLRRNAKRLMVLGRQLAVDKHGQVLGEKKKLRFQVDPSFFITISLVRHPGGDEDSAFRVGEHPNLQSLPSHPT